MRMISPLVHVEVLPYTFYNLLDLLRHRRREAHAWLKSYPFHVAHDAVLEGIAADRLQASVAHGCMSQR